MSTRSSSSSSSSSTSSSNKNDDEKSSLSAKQQEKRNQYQARESKYKHLSLQEFWKLKKQERKERMKARNKERKEELNKEWDNMNDEEKEQVRLETAEKYDRKRREAKEFLETATKNLSSAETPTLVFDLHFANTMTPRDVKSTTNQLKLSVSEAKKEMFLMKPIFVSGREEPTTTSRINDEDDGEKKSSSVAGGETRETAENNNKHKPIPDKGDGIYPHLQQFEGFKKFPPQFIDGPVHKVLDPEKTIYLTADSENILWELKPGENYVIGAFVDHNQMKGATFNYATERNMKTARLPIGEAIKVGNRCKVLTINHVVEVLLNFAKTRDWATAFLKHLPTRRVIGQQQENNGGESAKKDAPQRREREEDEEEKRKN